MQAVDWARLIPGRSSAIPLRGKETGAAGAAIRVGESIADCVGVGVARPKAH